MKSTTELREYSNPEVTKVHMDNEISLTLSSDDDENTNAGSSKIIAPIKQDPFKTNLA